MRTLVYKRTHNGDPSIEGVFGCNDCMKSVRSWDYGAVIGVGGQSDEPETEGIAEKLTWIGIGPHKTSVPGKEHPEVSFEHFLYYGPAGPDLRSVASHLADLMYIKKARNVMTFNADEQADVDKLLAMAAHAPPSVALASMTSMTDSDQVCKPRQQGCAS